MLRFLAVALLSLHLTCGENLILGPKGVNSSRFTFEDGEYEIVALRTDWYTARNLCKMQGGKLMSIETQAENFAVLHALGDYMEESFWTSGSDIDTRGLFYWDATGANFENFTFWGSGRPVANNTEHCVALNSSMNHLWADAECDLETSFVCEFHPCSVPMEHEQNVEKAFKDPLLTFTFENGTYEVYDDSHTWVGSKNACKRRGMELVSIETFEEHLAIIEALISLPPMKIWTSGSDMGHWGNFYWEATGLAVGPYTGWAPGHPRDLSHDLCILLTHFDNYMWDSYGCSSIYVFEYICELQPCQS